MLGGQDVPHFTSLPTMDRPKCHESQRSHQGDSKRCWRPQFEPICNRKTISPRDNPKDEVVFDAMDASTATLHVIQQPPPEITTNEPLPLPVIARLRGLELSPFDGGTSFEGGLVWGQVSLASADGRTAMAQFDPDMLRATSLTVPLIHNGTPDEDEFQFTLTFEEIIIRQPGYFKLHINVIIAAETNQNGSFIFHAPNTIISAESRVIRASAFLLPKRIKYVADILFHAYA